MPPRKPQPRRPVVPTDFPAFESKLELICKACQKKGKYAVGRIFIDPGPDFKPGAPKPTSTEMACFTGYFHCKHCGAGGPWQLSGPTMLVLLGQVLQTRMNPEQACVQFGRIQMFDGTVVHSGTEAEAHLQKLIAAHPEDYYLWSRLGNVYVSAEQDALAEAAFTRAIELNPRDVESHHSLGHHCLQKEHYAEAATHYHLVLRHCRSAPRCPPQLLHDIVRDALEHLFELHSESDGAIDFLPPPDPDPAAPSAGDTHVVQLFNLDLSREQSWEALTSMYLTGKAPGSSTARTPEPRPLPRPIVPAARAPARVGRNDRCPCGGGKKFKHCCGRSR